MEMPPGFTLASITAREDARDAFVSNNYRGLVDLPQGAVVGTSSLRREAQLRERFPHLQIEPLRGNVNTRLRKLDEGKYDAIILAAAGLKRLGFGTRIASLLEPDESLPAPGQGALALECRSDRANIVAALAPLADFGTTLATTLNGHSRERWAAAATRRLQPTPNGKRARSGFAGCSRVATVATSCAVNSKQRSRTKKRAEQLGQELADDFLGRGAARFFTT